MSGVTGQVGILPTILREVEDGHKSKEAGDTGRLIEDL